MRPAMQLARHMIPLSSDGNHDAEQQIESVPRTQGQKRYLEVTANDSGGQRRRLDDPMEHSQMKVGTPQSGLGAYFDLAGGTRDLPLSGQEKQRLQAGAAGVFGQMFTDIPRNDVKVPILSRMGTSIPAFRDVDIQPGVTHGNETVTHVFKLEQRNYGQMFASIGQMNDYIPEGLITFVETRPPSADHIGVETHILSVAELNFREYTRRGTPGNFRMPAQVYEEWQFAGLPLLMQPQADATYRQTMWLENVICKIVMMKDVFCDGPLQRAKNGYYIWAILVVRTEFHEDEERDLQLRGLLGKGGISYKCQNSTHGVHKQYTRCEFYTQAGPVLPQYVYKTCWWKGRDIPLGQVQEFSTADVDDDQPDSDQNHLRMVGTARMALYRKGTSDSMMIQQRDAVQQLDTMQISTTVFD